MFTLLINPDATESKMSKRGATPNKPKTDWVGAIGALLVMNLIGFCLAGGAGRQAAIEQAHAHVPAEIVRERLAVAK